MADVNDNTKNFIDQLSQGNNDEAGEAFKAALRDKVADQLDTARKDLASNMFKAPTEAEDFSDPKPEIADPGVFNADGSISSSQQRYDDNIIQINDQINRLEERLEKRRSQLTSEFAKMQEMMSLLSRQQSFMYQFFR